MTDDPRIPSPPTKVEKLETRIDNLMRQNHFLRLEIRRWETRWSNLTHAHEDLHKDYKELQAKYEEVKKLNILYILDSTFKRIFP